MTRTLNPALATSEPPFLHLLKLIKTYCIEWKTILQDILYNFTVKYVLINSLNSHLTIYTKTNIPTIVERLLDEM